MSRAAKVLAMKFVITFVIALIPFNLIDRNMVIWVLPVSIVVTFFNYILGDFYVLPRLGNIVASVNNGVLAVLIVFFADYFITSFRTSSLTLFIFAALITAGEYGFHRYLMKSEMVAP